MTSADPTRHALTLARIALILGLNLLAALGAHSTSARPLPRLLPPALICCEDTAHPAVSR